MSRKIDTRFLSETDFDRWTSFVAESEGGSVYSCPEYLAILASEVNARFRILVAERDGQITGGIALFERDHLCGPFVSARYLLYYNGFVLKQHISKYPSERTAKELETLEALEHAISGLHYSRVLIKNRNSLMDTRVFLTRGWNVYPTYSYVVPLVDLRALWDRVEQNLRRLIGRCEREGIIFSPEDDDFDEFYRLHHENHVRKGAALYLPAASFRRYYERLRAVGLCALFHARNPEGRVISTQLVLLGRHPVTHTVAAAVDHEFMRTGAAAFLRWRVFEWLAARGYCKNDLTDAELNSVTHFKSQFGGDLVMNFVVQRPDNVKFRLHDAFYRVAGAAKLKAVNTLQRRKAAQPAAEAL